MIMADSNNGGVFIESSIDNSKLAAGAEQARKIIESIGRTADKTGRQIDGSLSVDSSRLRSELDKANRELQRLGATATEESENIGSAFGKIAAGIGAVFTVQKALEFGRSMVKVRSEIESLEISFTSLLGSKDKAAGLFSELREFAVSTPMMLGDLAKAAQMMLGFNVPVEEIMPMLRALGDISMGDAGRFQSLALAFSQMSATGKLMGQDLLQMINAGFNPLITISEKTGKAVKQLKEEMSAGAITADMVADAFKSAASEGGKYYGILENQAKGVAGSIAYMRGAWENMLNELGQQTQGVLAASFKLTGDLLKNYRNLGGVIADLVVAYGTYKAALIVLNVTKATSIAMTKGWTLAELAHYRALLLVEKAQKLLNATILKNPYVLAAAAVAGFVAALFRANRAHGMLAKAAEDAAAAIDGLNAKYEEEKNKADELIEAVNSETASRTRQMLSLAKLRAMYTGIIDKYIDEKGQLKDIIRLQKELNEEREKARVKENSDRLSEYRTMLRDYEMLQKAQQQGASFANAGVTNNLNMLFEDKPKLQTNANFIKEKVVYWRKMVEEQQKVVEADSDALWVERLRESTDAELDALQKAFEERRKMFGELTEKDAADLQKILDEKKRRSPENIVDNKEYYEKLKKEAQAELDALTKAEAAGAKGNELKKKIETYKVALKAYDTDTGSGKSKSDKNKSAEQLAKSEEEMANALNDEMAQLAAKAQQQAINGLEDGHERKMRQIEHNYTQEIAAVERWEREQKKKEEELQKERYKAGHGGSLQEFTLDTGTANYGKITEAARLQREQAETARTQALEEQREREERAGLEYLATWGKIYQKKEALQKLYAKKITDAETQGEKDSLARELETKLQGLSIDELKNAINWDLVFSGMERATKQQLQAVRKQLEAFRESEEFKTATPENIKTITEAIGNIDAALSEKSGFFGGLRDAMGEYKKALQEAKTAQEELNEAIRTGDAALIEAAQGKRNRADKKLQQTETNVGKSADTMGDKFKTLAGVMRNLSAESVSLADVGDAVQRVTNALSSSGSKWAGLVGGILSLLDVAATDVEGFTEGLIKKIGAALASLTAYFVKTATFGLVDMGPASYKEYEKAYARYERMMNLWEDLIRKQKEFLEQAVGDEAIKAAGNLRKTIQAEIDAAKATASLRLDSGASTGSHSLSYRMWRGSYKSIDGQNWRDVAAGIGRELGVPFRSMYDMLTMSAEQLQWIKENYTNLWAAMDGDFADLLDKIIEKQQQMEEITDSIKESLTRVSFDELYDSFTERLMDMDSSAKDFADDFAGYMRKAVTSIVADKYKEQLRKWYDVFAANNEDGVISPAEMDALKATWNEITEAAIKERDTLAALYGWDSSTSREAVAKGIATASQESVDENNGRLTAIQGHTWQIAADCGMMREQMTLVASNAAGILRGVQAIEEHTGTMSERLRNVENGMEAVRNAVNDISLRGLKMR